tara:strand:- start:48192 stop:48434 length:243 start_codon:yes stop_codon:yes gene_type:complete
MTELKMIIECSQGQKIEQTLKNERNIDDIELQFEIDTYVQKYISTFNETNTESKRYLKSLKLYYGDDEIRNITTNNNEVI